MNEKDEMNLFQVYLDEVEKIVCCDEAENQRLIPKAAAGEAAAKRRMVEGNLKLALGLIGDYIALVMAVEELAVAGLKGEAGEFERFLKGWVMTALQEIVKRQGDEIERQKEFLDLVNKLEDTARIMAEELGREATVEELAERMQMTVDEVKDIMKSALDAMNVSD